MGSVPEIPGYAISRLLGEGAHGRVFLARETDGLQREVALKVFAPEHREKYERELEMCRRVEEVRARARSLEIVQALGSGLAGDLAFIALEHVEAGSLMDVVRREGPLDPSRALGYAREAARALALLHEDGLFHRDVKPANLLVASDGRLKLSDFGLARSLSGTLSAAGSPAFAAPEIIAARPFDGRLADVYSLGATLFYLLTAETMLPGRVDVFALERRGLPRALQDVIVDATALDPAERIATMADLALRLETVADSKAAVALDPQEIRESPRVKSESPDGDAAGVLGAPRHEPQRSDDDMPREPITYADLTKPAAPHAPQVAKGAVASLVCALLVLPSLAMFAFPMFALSKRQEVASTRGPVLVRTAEIEDADAPSVDRMRGSESPSHRSQPPMDERAATPSSARPTADVASFAWLGIIVAIVLGLAPIVLEVLAFVCGFLARARIAASDGRLIGSGLAIAGIIIASLNLAVIGLVTLAAMAMG